MYKSFKTIEELIDWAKDNTKTLENGELTFSEWYDDWRVAEKYKKDYGLATDDKKSLRRKAEESEKKRLEVEEQLALVNNELAGLKDVHSSTDKDALQKLNKEKSDLITKLNALEAKDRENQAKLGGIPELEKQIQNYRQEINEGKVWSQFSAEAMKKKVPSHVINDPAIRLLVQRDLEVDSEGRVLAKGDIPQDVGNYIDAKQRELAHWQPLSQGSGASTDKNPNASEVNWW